jgi:hypothetical protein
LIRGKLRKEIGRILNKFCLSFKIFMKKDSRKDVFGLYSPNAVKSGLAGFINKFIYSQTKIFI